MVFKAFWILVWRVAAPLFQAIGVVVRVTPSGVTSERVNVAAPVIALFGAMVIICTSLANTVSGTAVAVAEAFAESTIEFKNVTLPVTAPVVLFEIVMLL